METLTILNNDLYDLIVSYYTHGFNLGTIAGFFLGLAFGFFILFLYDMISSIIERRK